jgi:zinc finger CCCH domain-containing protein 13
VRRLSSQRVDHLEVQIIVSNGQIDHAWWGQERRETGRVCVLWCWGERIREENIAEQRRQERSREGRRERDREREREREAERERETERERQREWETERERQREWETETEWDRERERDRWKSSAVHCPFEIGAREAVGASYGRQSEERRRRESKLDQEIVPLIEGSVATASVCVAIVFLVSSDDRVERVRCSTMLKRMNHPREASMATIVMEPWGGRGGQRERGRERERDRERETERETDQRGREGERDRERQRETERERQRERQRDRVREREMGQRLDQTHRSRLVRWGCGGS